MVNNNATVVAFGDVRLPLRFWDKVVPCDDGCWFWIGAISSGGYASFGAERGTVNAHRHAYLTLVGPITSGLELDHTCRDRSCVNPAHLEPVTKLVNILRGDSGKHQRDKTHCAQGHPYDVANTRWRSDRKNSRDCRACKNAAMKVLRRRLRPLTIVEADEVNALLSRAG